MNKNLSWVFLVLASITAIFFKMFVLTKIWNYIVVPMGAPPIGLMEAWGVCFIVNLITYKYEKAKNEELEVLWAQVRSDLVCSASSWFFAYLFFA